MINQTDLINHSSFYIIWQRVLFTPYLFCDFFYKTKLIPQEWQHTDSLLNVQLENAKEWRNTCLKYFQTFSKMKIYE